MRRVTLGARASLSLLLVTLTGSAPPVFKTEPSTPCLGPSCCVLRRLKGCLEGSLAKFASEEQSTLLSLSLARVFNFRTAKPPNFVRVMLSVTPETNWLTQRPKIPRFHLSSQSCQQNFSRRNSAFRIVIAKSFVSVPRQHVLLVNLPAQQLFATLMIG